MWILFSDEKQNGVFFQCEKELILNLWKLPMGFCFFSGYREFE